MECQYCSKETQLIENTVSLNAESFKIKLCQKCVKHLTIKNLETFVGEGIHKQAWYEDQGEKVMNEGRGEIK